MVAESEGFLERDHDFGKKRIDRNNVSISAMVLVIIVESLDGV